MEEQEQKTKIHSSRFYNEYHGHPIQDLHVLHRVLRRRTNGTTNNDDDDHLAGCISTTIEKHTNSNNNNQKKKKNDVTTTTTTTSSSSSSSRPLIWLAGDSSLDNKYWFVDERPAVTGSGYDQILHPPVCNADVTYWLNYYIMERYRDRQRDRSGRGRNRSQQTESSSKPTTATTTAATTTVPLPPLPMAAINTAVEATTLNERTWKLRSQDRFLKDHIQSNDILVVSVGGNDVAMAPTLCTICSILCLTSNCTPTICLDRGCVLCTVPFDDYCYGCGSSLLSCFGGACPPCLGYMIHLFGTRVQKYIERITEKTKPSKILVLMIYFPDEKSTTPSWANPALSCLGYNNTPEQLQTLIRRVYVLGTSNIQISGADVYPVPLFEVLDGTNPRDYIARVEPSSQGGQKMAEFILNVIDGGKGGTSSTSFLHRRGNGNGGGDHHYYSYGSTSSRTATTTTVPGAPVHASYMADRS